MTNTELDRRAVRTFAMRDSDPGTAVHWIVVPILSYP